MTQLAITEFREGPRNGVVAFLVACVGCGVLFTIRPRTMRDLKKQRRLPKCETCRRPPKVHVTRELLAWWTDPAGGGLTMEEVRELAAPINEMLAARGIRVERAESALAA